MLLCAHTFEVALCRQYLSHCMCFSMQLTTVVGGGGAVFLQQINISTHVSTHHSRWKLLQSFLWRRKMMPNQPRESGIVQNNGIIEDHEGESLPVWLWARASHWCPLAWRPHSRGFFPLRHGCDLIQLTGLQNTPALPPPNMHTCMLTHHTCVFSVFHCGCVPLYGQLTLWLTWHCPLLKGQFDP